jgi:hypothetical protein
MLLIFCKQQQNFLKLTGTPGIEPGAVVELSTLVLRSYIITATNIKGFLQSAS